MKIDIGRLTQDETAELLKECITALPTEQAITAIIETLSDNDQIELVASIEAKHGM